MKKKVLSMLVTIAMLFSMFPATAFAADFNVTADGNDLDDADSQEYYKFDEVANTATADDKIIIKEDMTYTLTEDTTLSAPLVVDGHSFTLDLGGKTLTVDGDNKFSSNAKVTIKNGTLSITGATASGDAIFCVGDYSSNATLNLEGVNVEGQSYSSAYAVFYVYGESTLNMTGGSVTVSDDSSAAGGVFKAESSTDGKINITGTETDPVELTFDDAKIGFLDGTVVMDYVDLDITGGANAINQSALTVKNSSLTISGANGRALTLKNGDVTVENSTLDFSDCSEGEIRFKAGVSLTADEDSTITACTTYADSYATGANINGTAVTATEDAKANVTVDGGTTTIVAAPIGTVTPAYTRSDAFWGEGTANATKSFVVELYEGSTKIASSSLRNKDNIIGGDVYVTWSIPFDGEDSDYWDVEWAEGYPKYDMNPDKVKLIADGTQVATNNVQYNAPDNLNKIVALAEGNTGGVVAYTSLAGALAAAADGDTIELIWSEGDEPIAMNGEVYGNKTVTITGTAKVDWSKGWLFVGRGGEGDGKLIFSDAHLTAAANGGRDIGIHVSGATADTTKNDGVLEITNGSNIELDWLVNRNEVTVDGNSTLTVVAGLNTHGRNAEEAESGEAQTATLTVKAGSTLTQQKYTAAIGNESYGVLNIEGTVNVPSMTVKADSTVNVNGGTLVVTDTLTTNKNLFISGNSVVEVEDLQGRATVLDGTVLTNSYIKSTTNGTTRVLGDLTLNGGFGAGYLMTAGSNTEVSGYEGTITIEDGTDVAVSYGVEMNGKLNLNGGTIKLSGDDASGNIWGCVFQSGTFDINTDIVVVGNKGTHSPVHFTNATATINSSISQSESGGEPIYIKNSTVTVTEDASVTTDCAVYVNEAGTLESAGDITGNVKANAADAAIKITAGTVKGEISEVNGGSVTVSGGAFSTDPKEFLANQYYTRYKSSDGLYYVIVDGAYEDDMVADVNGVQYTNLRDAIDVAKAGDTVTIYAGEYTGDVSVNKDITVVGQTDAEGNNLVTINGKVSVTGAGATVKNLNINNASERAMYISGGNILIEGCELTGVDGLRYCYANDGDVTLKDCVITGSTYGVHFDGGTGDGDVIINGCTITGWTSFGSTIEEVTITDTTFADGNYNLLRFYQNATLTNVTIPSGNYGDYQGSGMRIDTGNIGAGMEGITVTANNCKTADDSDFAGAFSEGTIKATNVFVDDELLGVVAKIGETGYKTLAEAFAAAKNGDEVKILAAGTYELGTSGKDITITGEVDGVVFDNIGAKNMGGANVTFNNVTFDYYPNVNYTGLQHSGNLIYNGCIVNGQVFLYGTSETFNDCTFNQSSADAYNVWTYGAQIVNFKDCEFNSAGKSVLVYNEGACATNLTVVNTKFIASAPVEGKAAIEIDTTLMPDGTDIVIDAATTATGFDKGSISGEALWNDKKDQTDLTVTVKDEKVWPRGKAVIDHGFQTIINSSKPRKSITTTLKNVYASESLVLKIYSGETLLGTTTLREYEDGDTSKPLYPAIQSEYTVNNVITGVESGSWETMWDVELTRKNVPTKIEVYADGVLTDTYEDTNGCFLNDEENAKYIELFDLTFTVTFDTNGGSSVDAQEIVSRELATRPATAPTKSGHTFVNWYSDEALTSVFDFSAPITADTTVYAKWNRNSSGGGGGGSTSYTIAVEDTKNGDITVSPSRASSGSTVIITVDPDNGYELDELTVLDKNGKKVELTKKSDSKYTFKMPSGKVTVGATFMEDNTMLNYFTDVFASDYYYDAVLWAVENGITNGTSATTFSPADPCTRAQMATFLWRAAGSPEPSGDANPFVDVPNDAYYAKAVQWAYEQGITGGTSATTFSPDQTCTRGQMATFLWRDAGSSAVSGEGAPFVDVPDDVYYATAVDWAYEEGITGGTSATTYSPNDPCTRGQMVTFLYRYLAE